MSSKHRKHDLLHVGVGVFEGSADNQSWSAAVSLVMNQIRRQVPARSLPPRIVLLYATAGWCKEERPLGALVRASLARHYRVPPVPLIGGSSPGVFVSIPADRPGKPFRLKEGFVVVVLFSEDLWANIVAVHKPHGLSPEIRKVKIMEAACKVAELRRSHVGLGTSAASDLFAVFPGPYIAADQTRVYGDHELHQELLSCFNDLHALFGGSAANAFDRPTVGFQFIDDDCLESSLVIALLEHDFRTGAAMAHGLQPVRGLRAVVDELEGNENFSDRVTRINGMPAADALRDLMARSGFMSPRPVLGLGGGDNCHIAAPLEAPGRWGDSVVFNRKIYKGYRLAVLGGTNQTLQQGADEVHQMAWTRSGASPTSIRLVFGQACIGRHAKFTDEKPNGWWEENETMAAKTEHAAPIVIVLVAGEFGEDHRRRARSDNFSVWSAALTAEPSGRALNRLLQRDLLRAGSRVIKATLPQHVMSVAITEAVKLGASGGLVCIADPTVGKIVGGRHGCVRPAGLSALLRHTLRDLRKPGETYTLNPELREWSVPLAARETKSRLSLVEGTDILTIACANRRVFFVPDTQRAAFFCDRKTAQLAGISSLLVLPLIGSEGRVLGTLQLHFASPTMNREAMGLWAGFGQKVALALERAQEVRENTAVTALVRIENELLQRLAPATPYPLDEIREFLEELKDLLGADYLHARILAQGSPERFGLAAVEGDIGDKHRSERLFTTRHDGSMAKAIENFERHGVYTSTREETRKFFHARKEVVKAPWTSEFRKAVRKFATVGDILIGTPDRPVGCIVVRSKDQYFFTGPRQKLLWLATLKLESILRKREADFRQRQTKELEESLTNTFIANVDSRHEIMRPLTNMKQFFVGLRRDLASRRDIGPRIAALESELSRTIEILVRPAFTAGETGKTEEVIVLIKRLCLDKSIYHEITPDGWEGVDPASINVNRFVESALRNLLINAKEALDAAKSVEPVKIKLERIARGVHIAIENGGSAITEDDVRRMMNPEFTTKGDGHRGYGLPLAYLMIARQGGTLSLAVRQGGGVVATVVLPEAEKQTNKINRRKLL